MLRTLRVNLGSFSWFCFVNFVSNIVLNPKLNNFRSFFVWSIKIIHTSFAILSASFFSWKDGTCVKNVRRLSGSIDGWGFHDTLCNTCFYIDCTFTSRLTFCNSFFFFLNSFLACKKYTYAEKDALTLKYLFICDDRLVNIIYTNDTVVSAIDVNIIPPTWRLLRKSGIPHVQFCVVLPSLTRKSFIFLNGARKRWAIWWFRVLHRVSNR